ESKREAARRGALEGVEGRAQKLRFDIYQGRAQLVAVNKWLLDNRAAMKVPEDAARRMRESVLYEGGVLAELEAHLVALEQTIRLEKDAGPQRPISNDELIRMDYASALKTEIEALAVARARTDAATQTQVLRLERARDRLGQLDAGLHDFRDKIAT